MKPIGKEALAALAAISILAAPGLAKDGKALKALKKTAGPAAENLIPAPPARSAAVPAVAHYAGLIEIHGTRRRACFSVSTEVINPYEGDPDVRGNYSYQDIPVMRQEGAVPCTTRFEHNGRYLLSCSGHYLILSSPELAEGEVFTTLRRFNPDTGELAVQPVGKFSFARAAGCGR